MCFPVSCPIVYKCIPYSDGVLAEGRALTDSVFCDHDIPEFDGRWGFQGGGWGCFTGAGAGFLQRKDINESTRIQEDKDNGMACEVTGTELK